MSRLPIRRRVLLQLATSRGDGQEKPGRRPTAWRNRTGAGTNSFRAAANQPRGPAIGTVPPSERWNQATTRTTRHLKHNSIVCRVPWRIVPPMRQCRLGRRVQGRSSIRALQRSAIALSIATALLSANVHAQERRAADDAERRTRPTPARRRHRNPWFCLQGPGHQT
jgi:hypothetical protein